MMEECTAYSQQVPPFHPEEKFITHLPKDVAIMRAIAIEFFTILIATSFASPLWFWPVFVIGTVLAVRDLYITFLNPGPDPLIKAFYKIVGGKENFDQLPSIYKIVGGKENFDQLPSIPTQPNVSEVLEYAKRCIRLQKTQCQNTSLYKGLLKDGRQVIGVIEVQESTPGSHDSQTINTPKTLRKTLSIFVQNLRFSETLPFPITEDASRVAKCVAWLGGYLCDVFVKREIAQHYLCDVFVKREIAAQHKNCFLLLQESNSDEERIFLCSYLTGKQANRWIADLNRFSIVE